MDFTSAKVKICNLSELSKCEEVELMVDTGALYALVPKDLLEKLNIKPKRRRSFTLANGETIERDIADVLYQFDQFEGAAPVIFGEPNDKSILGVMALEAMGLEVNPITRELKPTSLPLI